MPLKQTGQKKKNRAEQLMVSGSCLFTQLQVLKPPAFPPAMALQHNLWFLESVSREKQREDTAGGVLYAFNAFL